MKLRTKWMTAAAVLLILAATGYPVFKNYQTRKLVLQAQQETQKAAPSITLADTDVVGVKMLALSQGLPIAGSIKAVNSAFVKARVSGELQDLSVREGDFVKAGQVIARIDTTESAARLRQAQQQAQAANAQVDIAQRSLDNNRSLVEQGFISKTSLDASASNLAASQATWLAAQAGAEVLQKALDDALLRAPMGGQVAQRLAQNGERVGVDARVVEIVDLSRLELEASLSAAESMQVKVGQMAQLRIEGAATAVAARVVRSNPSAVAGTRAVLVYLAIAPTTGLRQGLFAQGLLATGTQSALALPLSAVRTDKPLPYVQVVVGGKVTHQTVQLGQRGELGQEAMVAVSGVNEDALVLVGGIGPVIAGTAVTGAGSAK
jgi:RND family efflux transporter MFP subunit